MLKIKINKSIPDNLQPTNYYIKSNFEILLENPLNYYDPEDPNKIVEFQRIQDITREALLDSYSIDFILYNLRDIDVSKALLDSEGVACLSPSRTLTVAGNVIEVLEQSNKSEGPGVVKIDKSHFINLKRPLMVFSEDMDKSKYHYYEKTEQWYKIEEYQEGKEKSANELRKTFRRLTNIINANTAEPEKCLWVTLTYKDNIQGAEGNEQLYKDFKTGIQRLRRKFGHFEYISVVEPQGRGAWHCHCIFIFNKKTYIPNKEISAAWGQGFTKTKKMDSNVDNLGSYLTAYLCDIPLDDLSVFDFNTGVEVTENCPIVEKEGKKFIKGGRLYLYPPYMKLYRTSRGIKQPEVIKDITEAEVSSVVGDLPMLYEVSYELKLDTDSDYKNVVRYKQYNKTITTKQQRDQRQNKLNKNKQ